MNSTSWLNPFSRPTPTPTPTPTPVPAPAPAPAASKRQRAASAVPSTPLSRQLLMPQSVLTQPQCDDIEDSEGDEGVPDARQQQPTVARAHFAATTPMGGVAARAPVCACATPASCSTAPRRSALASGLQLSAQHGETGGSGRGGTGRRAGAYGMLVARAQADRETKVITARHGILRPSLAPAETVRAALSDPTLQRLRLRLCRVLASAPLCVVECEHRGDSGQPVGPLCHVMLRRDKFESVCRAGGGVFVVFPPWHEVKGVILARNCEQDPVLS